MKLKPAELARLKTAHPDLQKVVMRLAQITAVPFVVLEVSRTVAQQRINVKKGVSWTMRSRHIPGSNKCKMACAVDLAPSVDGKASYAWPYYYKLEPFVRKAAKDVGVLVEWGGDWRQKDGPHWQLPWKQYP